MSKKITTYEELLAEEQRLVLHLRSRETMIKQDIAGIKEHLKPVGKVYNFFYKMSTRDHTGPLANFGIDFGIDLVIRKLLLAKAGWFTKILVPFIVKNYSSHVITEEHRDKFAEKIRNIFDKIRPKKSRQKQSEN